MAVAGYDRVLALEALGRIEAFKGCSKQDLGLVADALSARRTIKSGDDLCREGDAAEHWWIVLDGNADVTVGDTTVGQIGKDEPVGELALFDGQPRSATVSAMSDLDVLVFDKSNFIDAVTAAPQLALNLLSSASRRLRATNALV